MPILKLPFKFVAIDTIDVMYKQAVSYVLKRESRKDGKKYQAVNDIPWGKGHEYIEIEDYADRIDMLNSDLLEIILRKCPEEIESKLLDAEELFFKENYYEVEGEQE